MSHPSDSLVSEPRDVSLLDEGRLLSITWKDGHVSAYPYDLLRRGCPCAECTGRRQMSRPDESARGKGSPEGPEREERSPEGRPEGGREGGADGRRSEGVRPGTASGLKVLEGGARARRAGIAALHPVGLYALNIRFTDGHASGIFSFDLLRQLCPCPGCRAGREKAG